MASGNSLVSVNAQGGIPPSANYATFDVRNFHPVLDFDASTEEAVYFQIPELPRHYAGGGLTVDIFGMLTTATSGGVTLGVSVERNHAAGDDLDADSFATEKTNNQTAPGTSGQVLKHTISFTNAEIDGLLAGEPFRLKLARKVADAGDTAAGDYEFLALQIRET